MTLSMIRSNPIVLTDSYNLSHSRLKINTDFEVSHLYNRAQGMILYGLSEIINSILSVQITTEMINEAEEGAKRKGLTFPRELFEKIVSECNGYMPLHVQSLSEGTWVPKGFPFAQIRNTVKGYGECVTWLEGILMHSYFPSSCATEAFHMRRYLDSKQLSPWKLHSFGFRGHRSLEDAYWAGSAWNLFLNGTDDFHTVIHTPEAPIGSISALAHKVTQQFDEEIQCFFHAIDAAEKAGEPTVALVIDTYNAYRVINDYLPFLAPYAKQKGVHIVLRPDSGNVLEQAIAIYQQTQLHFLDNVSVIIGEGMSFEKVKEYDAVLESFNVPLNFVFYGVGGGYYNHITRDTLGFAMKTAFSNGSPRMKFSEVPIKRSIPGIVDVVADASGKMSVQLDEEPLRHRISLYETVYFHNTIGNEPLVYTAKWSDIKLRAEAELAKEALQEELILSQGILDLMKELAEKYNPVGA